MQCEAMTAKPGRPRCTRVARVVVGTRYWGDLATERTYGRTVRRTWVDFWAVCKQHTVSRRHEWGSPMSVWAHVFGAVQFGACNGQALGWVDTQTGEQHVIPQHPYDIKAAGQARIPQGE